MAAAQTDYYNFLAANVNVPTVTETVIGVSRPVSTAFAGQQLFVMFGFQFIAGTAATSATLRIKQGSDGSGSTISAFASVTVVAGNVFIWTIAATDQIASDVAGQSYCVTVTQAAATGNGTASHVWSSVTVG